MNVRRIIEEMRSWTVRKRSTVEVLRRLLKRREWRELELKTPDWRSLFADAAAMLKIPEERLLKEVAQRAGFSYAVHLRPINDAEVLSQGPKLAELRKAGAISIAAEGRISGFACVDPLRAAKLIKPAGKQGLFVSSWLSIARALDESERLLLQKEAKEAEQRLKQAALMAGKILSLMVEEARRFGAKELEVNLGGARSSYAFITEGGRRGEGGIDSRARAALLDLLQRKTEKSKPIGGALEGLNDLELQVRAEKPGLIFQVAWRDKAHNSYKNAVQEQSPPEEPRLNVTQVSLGADESQVIEVEAPAGLNGFSADGPGAQQMVSRVLSFPSEASDLKPAAAGKSPNLAASLALIVDDNRSFIRVLERFLERHGFQIQASLSCEEAKQMLESRQVNPQVVICDIHLPGMNGFQFLEWFRAQSFLNPVPLAMLSSDDDVETRLRVLNLGADVFVAKTEDPRILCAQVKQLIERRQAA